MNSPNLTHADYIPFARTSSYPIRAGNAVKICEAIEAAKKSVWVTVAFIWPEFRFPDGRDSLFDVLDGAASRGLDVRVIFWRPNPETVAYESTAFSGTPEQRAMLAIAWLSLPHSMEPTV